MSNLFDEFKNGSYISERIPDRGIKIIHDQYEKWVLTSGLKKEVFEEKIEKYYKGFNIFSKIISSRCDFEISDRLWIDRLNEIFKETCKYNGNHSYKQSVFYYFTYPFLDWALRKIDFEFKHIFDYSYINAVKLRDSLINAIQENLDSLVSRTLILDLNIERLKGNLVGKTSDERYHSYSKKFLESPKEILKVLKEYSVLARLIVSSVEKNINNFKETLSRYISDRRDLIEKKFISDSVLVSLNKGLGDDHNNGRSIMCLKFDNGHKLIYKPRSLHMDKKFEELITWINQKNFQPELKYAKSIDKKSYGWQKFINYRACNKEKDIELFYERQGAYTALLYILNATDFHLENMIAHSAYPILVDLESLFQNKIEHKSYNGVDELAWDKINNSVILTGMLPVSNYTGVEFDLSGIGGSGNQELPFESFDFQNVGTDNMKLVKTKQEYKGSQNQPLTSNDAIQPSKYINSIIKGFTSLYNLFKENKKELLNEDGPIEAFKDVHFRFIYRNTATYAEFLEWSLHPDYLMNGLDRSLLFENIWNKKYLQNLDIIFSEYNDLLNHDIPYFYAGINSKDLITSRGERISQFFEKESLTIVKERIKQLSTKDCKHQIEFIRQCFSNLSETQSNLKHSENLEKSVGKTLPELIGDFLISKSIKDIDNNFVTFISKKQIDSEKFILSPIDESLYEGLLGIGLFFLYLNRQYNKDEYKNMALRCINSAKIKIHENENISAFYGLCSYLYVLNHYIYFFPEKKREFAEDIKMILNKLDSFKDNYNNELDFIGGYAGSIIVLLNIYCTLRIEDALSLAKSFGNFVLEYIDSSIESDEFKMLTGISHGASGIALALKKLENVTGDKIYENYINMLIEYEDYYYSKEKKNWRDLRNLNNEYQNFWCHGAPGILLARSNMNINFDGAEQKIIIDKLLSKKYKDITLCHGKLGVQLIILELAKKQNNQTLIHLVSDTIEEIERSLNLNSIKQKFELDFGLMTGAAGVGYALLYGNDFLGMPNILTLEQPIL
ncbi:type 2 lanthipeptide synthetase LanM family protein [Bacillus velezensis]|uniref:type 2 lanthipeptide synthetase LanM family protein n=1 Tax=Bacillus velezensis TaxID=492670 RepID=UPI00112472E6|nr:type 2 lanthipeptide synthetase LanM [Bacillus velezensis]MEE4560654.1 type 2 lanthipeptide synthetase LanM [Bacillus velezensis]TNU28036.1 type 2 lantipeptide synthetase LanM [Bacillus velezensis]